MDNKWGFPEKCEVTIQRHRGQTRDVLFNGRALPPFLRDTLKVEFLEGVSYVTLSFMAFDVRVEDVE